MKQLIKKYNTFIKYIIVAGISFLIDITLFTIFNYILNNKIFIATVGARIISSLINHSLNKEKVFKSSENKLKTLIQYYILVVIQMTISGLSVNFLYSILNINATLIKVPVECILFICNYIIQKLFIFRGNNEKNNKK